MVCRRNCITLGTRYVRSVHLVLVGYLRGIFTEPDFQPWVPQLILRLVPILLNPTSPKSLTENAAVTIGRIGLVQPDAVAPHLESFAQAWYVPTLIM